MIFINLGASKEQIDSALMQHEHRMVGSKYKTKRVERKLKIPRRRIVCEAMMIEAQMDVDKLLPPPQSHTYETTDYIEKTAIIEEHYVEKWNKYKGEYFNEKVNEVFIGYKESQND